MRKRIPDPARRLQEIFRRLTLARPFSSLEEAYGGLVAVLEEVEDELTGIPNNPDNWRHDGRLYPPQRDHWFEVAGHPRVVRMRTKGHNVFIAPNGALEIRVAGRDVVVFSKAGADGKGVWNP